jgi:DNA-binding FadR family transcriptional regulator
MRKNAGVDLSAYTAADVSFHLQIAEVTQNPLFSLLVTPLVDIIVHGMFESVQMEHEGMLSGIAEHEKILDRLRAGDAEGAKREMESHLARSRAVHPAKVLPTSGG